MTFETFTAVLFAALMWLAIDGSGPLLVLLGLIVGFPLFLLL